MILIIRFSFTHTHTRREKSIERSETKHKLAQSRLKIPQKKNERRKATNNTNEYS